MTYQWSDAVPQFSSESTDTRAANLTTGYVPFNIRADRFESSARVVGNNIEANATLQTDPVRIVDDE